jgi:chitinase
MLKKLVLIVAIVLLFGTVFTLPVQAASSYSVSGTVTVNGVGLKGVTVTIKGTTMSAVTNGLGNYAIHYVPAGSSGTIVPTLANYTFTPLSIAFAKLSAGLTGQNFTAKIIKPVVYSISGKVLKGTLGLPGVLITFGTFTATTATNGTYTIANIPAGTRGRIIPSLAGYAFTPTSITVSGLTANLVNENFTGTIVFAVSGKVTDQATGLPLGGVTVTLGTHSAVTSTTTGAYTIRNVPAGTSGVLTPSLAGKTFTPLTLTITNLQADVHAQNFVAAP